jgi:hypothetical protein
MVRPPIGVEDKVVADDRQTCQLTLSGQNTVKGIAMVKGQRGHGGRVIELNSQHFDSIDRELRSKKGAEGLDQVELAEAQLDGHFPDAGHTEPTMIGRVWARAAFPHGNKSPLPSKPDERPNGSCWQIDTGSNDGNVSP